MQREPVELHSPKVLLAVSSTLIKGRAARMETSASEIFLRSLELWPKEPQKRSKLQFCWLNLQMEFFFFCYIIFSTQFTFTTRRTLVTAAAVICAKLGEGANQTVNDGLSGSQGVYRHAGPGFQEARCRTWETLSFAALATTDDCVLNMCASVYTSFPLESVTLAGGRGPVLGGLWLNPSRSPGLLSLCSLSHSQAFLSPGVDLTAFDAGWGI